MKVYIGPYRLLHIRMYSFFDDYMSWKHKKPYWSIDDEEYTKIDKLLEKFFDVLQEIADATINKILAKLERKIKVRIDPYDVWSMDNTLAYIIHPMLVQLKEQKHGGPFVADEDVPEHLRSTAAPAKENDWDTDDNHFKRWDRWDWVLEELIWTFTQIKEDNWESQYYKDLGEIDFDSSKEDDTISWKRKPVIDWEGRNKHQERITNGLKLFGKYYQALWD